MYVIRSQGKVLDYCAEPLFVKFVEGNPVPQPCPQWEADALSVKGTCYSIFGKDPVKWPEMIRDEEGNVVATGNFIDAPEAVAVEKDVTTILFNNENELATVKDDVKTGTTQIEEYLMEMDTMYSEYFTMLSDALIEIDSMINGNAEEAE